MKDRIEEVKVILEEPARIVWKMIWKIFNRPSHYFSLWFRHGFNSVMAACLLESLPDSWDAGTGKPIYKKDKWDKLNPAQKKFLSSYVLVH